MFRFRFKKSNFLLIFILIASLILSGLVSPALGNETERTGVLIIAHGSNEESWNNLVRDIKEQVASMVPYPVALGFLEFVPNQSIADAVSELENEGISRIIAVPLFISSASNHIEEIKYVLGLRPDLPGNEQEGEGEEEELEPVHTEAEIILTSALDDHKLVMQILKERILTISQNPSNEILVLTSHGYDNPEYGQKWNQNMSSLCRQLKEELGFADSRFGYAAMGEPGLRSVVEEVYNYNSEKNILVMPVMLSRGYFTDRKIPQLLDGLDYLYPSPENRALLPHSHIALWASMQVNDIVLGSLQIKHGNEVKNISYSDIVLEDNGKICVCGSFVFRIMQYFSQLFYPEAVPEKDNFTILAPDTNGVKDALAAILPGNPNITFETRNQAPDFYDFIIHDAGTLKDLKVKVKPDVYPENFFELKAKIKSGTATNEEKNLFKQKRDELVYKLRWEKAENLFDICYPVKLEIIGGSASFNISSGNNYFKEGEIVKLIPYQVESGKYLQTLQIYHGNNELSISAENGQYSFIMPNGEVTVKVTLQKSNSANVGGGSGSSGNTSSSKSSENNSEIKLKLSYDKALEITPKNTYSLELEGAKLLIPSQAVLQPVNITVQKVDINADLLNTAYKQKAEIVSDILEFKVFPNIKFAKPVSVTIKFDSKKVSPYHYPAICYLNEEKNVWIPLSEQKVDMEKEEISGIIEHFTKFAVLQIAKADTIDQKSGDNKNNKPQFSDIKNHWAYSYIERMVTDNLINGYPDGSFRPDKPMSRGEFCTLIVRMLENKYNYRFDTAEKGLLLKDIKGHWSQEYIVKAYNAGLMVGDDQGRFAPDSTITREQTAVIIAKISEITGKGKKEENHKLLNFADAYLISFWAKSGVQKCVDLNIMQGYPDNKFYPDKPCTRSEICVILNNLLYK